MYIANKPKLLISAIALFSLTGATHAATVFITNNTTPKTLASNESDAFAGLTTGGADDGNTNGLDQDTAGASTVLQWSADDGGNFITFATSDVSGSNKLVMDGDSMGHGNDKWGNSQNWTFSLDKSVSFDALTFKTINEDMTLQSAAWKDDTATSGTNWSFASDGTLGTFTFDGTSDFTASGVSFVPSGTSITFGFLGSAGGGEELTSFTLSPVPEPSAFALIGLAGLGLLLRRRR